MIDDPDSIQNGMKYAHDKGAYVSTVKIVTPQYVVHTRENESLHRGMQIYDFCEQHSPHKVAVR